MRDELTIVNAAESEVKIFNVTGQLSFNKLCKTDKETINISNLVPGVYVDFKLQIKDGTGAKYFYGGSSERIVCQEFLTKLSSVKMKLYER